MRHADSGRGARGRRFVQIAVSALAIALIARNVNLEDAARLLGRARPLLVVAAILLYLIGQVMSAFRWRLIGSAVGLEASFVAYVRFYFIGMFFMFFGPSTLGGDVVRGLYLAEETGHGARAFNSVIFDRLNGLVVLVAIGAGAFLLFPGYDLPAPLLYATVLLGAGLFGGWWLAPVLVRALLPPTHRVRRFVEVDLEGFWRDRSMLMQVTAVSFVFHFVQIATLLVVSRALGLAVPVSYICVFHPLVSALASLPITLSGLGLREGGYLWFLRRIGIDEAGGVAFGGLWLLVIVANSLVGGLVFVLSGARLPRFTAGSGAGSSG